MYQGNTYNSLCLHQSVPEWCAVDDKCPPFEVSYRCSNGCCPVWESFIWANTPRGSQIFTHSTSIYKPNVFKLVCFFKSQDAQIQKQLVYDPSNGISDGRV